MSEWCHGCPLEGRYMTCNQDAEDCERECRKLWPGFYLSLMPTKKSLPKEVK